MRASRLPHIAAFLSGAVGLHLAILAFRSFFAWASRSYFPLADLAAGIVSWLVLGLGGLVAVGIYSLLRQRTSERRIPRASRLVPSRRMRVLSSTVGFVLALAWAATGFLGVPAVITSLSHRSVSVYKDFAARQPILLTLPHYPRIEATVAVPVLPGFILVSYGAQLAGQAGGGGWYLYLWWGAGSRQLHYWPRWMS
jgi:hypothetical protein